MLFCEWACSAWYVSVSRTPPPEPEAFQEPQDVGEFVKNFPFVSVILTHLIYIFLILYYEHTITQIL